VSPELLGIIERWYKAAILVPVIGAIAWWLFSNWVDGTLNGREAGVGLALLAGAFVLGAMSIASGGWGLLSVLALVYAGLVGLAVWEYSALRQREREQMRERVEACREAIERDPRNAGAWSYLGEAYLRLGEFEAARESLERALELDPKSRRDQRLLREAREGRARVRWPRLE
jgi:tetratricopeptide (TPR) repeat protein